MTATHDPLRAIPGPVTAVSRVTDPASGRPVWLSGGITGLWRSTDGGRTWASAYEQFGSELATFALAEYVHAGRAAALAGVAGGVLRSSDAGRSWEPVSTFPDPEPAVTALAAVTVDDAETILVAGTAQDGVYRLTVGDEASWEAPNLGLVDPRILCVRAAPGPGGRPEIYAGVESGLFRSANGARSWSPVELPSGFDAVLCCDAPAPGVVLVGTHEHGLLISRDAGRSWEARELCHGPVNQVHTVPTPSGPCTVVAVEEQVFVTRSLGRTFEPLEPPGGAATVVTALSTAGEGMLLTGSSDGLVTVLRPAADGAMRIDAPPGFTP